MSNGNEKIEIYAEVEHETPRAYLLDVGREKPEWFPKSQVEDAGNGCFLIPEWLAEKHDLTGEGTE